MGTQHTKVRILIVDDDQDDFIITSEYIKHIAGTFYEISWCPKYYDALQQMMEHNYDLYLVDYRLGAKSGVDLLKEALENNCEEPIILLTGKGNYNVDIEAMQLGAVDYLIKTELSIEKMERSIRYALERSATLKELKANERKYRSIFEKSKDIVFLTDEFLDFKDVNEVVYSFLGYTKDEVLQMNLTDLMDQAQHKKFLQQSLQTRKEVNDWEVVLNTKSGEKKSAILTATLEDNYTEYAYVQGIIHDITNLKKIEKANLQTEKLAAAGRLVRTLAHEVRNPLNNITLSVEQMQQEVKSDETAMLYLNIIQRNGKRINDLISELLSTSRPSEIELEECPLQSIVDDVITSAIDRLTLKRIKLQVSYPDEGLKIKADREKLKIALLNIVINAIEAMEEKKGNLVISIHQLTHHAVLNINDNGCGISEENITRLFEPYFTQKRNGVGLGLAFTLNILQSHKANIEVSSIESGGTTFTITFPLAGTADDQPSLEGISELQQ
ncbi:MAG TPA: ATP-binding protein [Flavipsychrobacter sp.]|nr:ATP-binding protein [Flavipsychrobacter sp.]